MRSLSSFERIADIKQRLSLTALSNLAWDDKVKGHNGEDPLFERLKHYRIAIERYNKEDDKENSNDARDRIGFYHLIIQF